jgi:hypothetical protein
MPGQVRYRDRFETNQIQCWISNARLDYNIWMGYSSSQRLGRARNVVRDHLANWGLKDVPRWRNDRTAYIVGLFGTGRWYINELLIGNIGDRVAFFRDSWKIPSQAHPTSMIYSGHATIKHVCRAQTLPVATNRILETVRSRHADWIFIFRHPFDSLLTNWIWWRTYLRKGRLISGISQIYKNSSELSFDLEQNFIEFKAFADGDPGFFAADPGLPFLSFAEFVEETELHLKHATLALRLEDFTVDPLAEFSKIVEVMSLDVDLNRLRLAAPKAKPYRYLTVREQAPRFKDFIDRLNPQTKRQIENIGYSVDV